VARDILHNVPSLPPLSKALPSPFDKVASKAASTGYGVKVLAGSGILRPYSPLALAKAGRLLQQWGTGPAGGFLAISTLLPERTWIIDELGELTFREVDRRTNRLARALSALGVEEGSAVALMARNHRGFVEASIAAAKLGADLIYLNTAFAGPQLVDVLEREDPAVVIHDEEFAGMLEKAHVQTRVLSWADGDGDGLDTLESLIEGEHDDGPLDVPGRHSRIVILTSGTTGTPKGAPRNEAGIDAAISLLSRMPLKFGWKVHIAAPLFHTWGFAHMMLSLLLGHTVVLRRRFDPEGALRLVDEQRCDEVVVIPVMLQRILGLADETLDQYSLRTVKVVAASGSALPGDLAISWMDHFGDNLYNTYGSTEVAYASIATPEDMRRQPSTAGKPPWATVVKIFDPDGKELPQGESGRIFVGNSLLFEGYTGGGHKDMIDGLMSSGDVGRFDEDGLLYVEGRDDEMIVSGGENVFPKEVEDCLARHEAVVEVAAIGVDDDDFGKRLRAFVVLRDGSSAGEDELKAHVKENLARYKVPREIITLDELPRNATGKVLKRELVDYDENGDPGSSSDDSGDSGDESGDTDDE
jgi:acyl-CoA synthetase (AMP-forming)/AMP-acid ligase II